MADIETHLARGVLDVMDVGGERKLVVSPVAAIGTDLLGLGASLAVLLTTERTELKILASVGTIWMSTALLVEIEKLTKNGG